MKRRYVRVTISIILFLLFSIFSLFYRDQAEKNKDVYFLCMVITGVCLALFSVYARKYAAQEEIDAVRKEEDNERFNRNRFWNNRVFQNYFLLGVGALILLIFFIINNSADVVFNFLLSRWYYTAAIIAIVPLFYYCSIYLGHFLLKLMWGENYEEVGVAGLKNLRPYFGGGAIIVIFYIVLWIYNMLK